MFLDHMRESQEDAFRFKAYFRAFIVIARNVTKLLSVEFKREPGFDEWWKKQKGYLLEDEVSQFFWKKRNRTLKRNAPGLTEREATTQTIILTPSERIDVEVRDAEGKRTTVPITHLTPSPDIPMVEEEMTWWSFEESNHPDLPEEVAGKNVINLCEHYLEMMEEVVQRVPASFH